MAVILIWPLAGAANASKWAREAPIGIAKAAWKKLRRVMFMDELPCRDQYIPNRHPYGTSRTHVFAARGLERE
jgi:hypothetical protein